ncbi:hypothetical protein [Roseobacter weihaiensis]|uniref:hypothetical protein n=1 Tax=Roseobacter weihaiensis TaxID=2763262 RepID=UPI001D0A2F2F|nr:hypothetical protein [Roseobacter sp. H9]
MPFKYEDYTNDEGIRRFGEISTNFDFGPKLSPATFPDDFVDSYVHHLEMFSEDVEDLFFVARYPDGPIVLWFNGMDDPAHIHSLNVSVAESLYAPEGSQIFPEGYYVVGEAYDADSQHMLLVDLRQDGGAYGSIHACQRSHDPWGEGDNIRGLAPLAADLGTFLQSLTTDAASLE